MGDAGWNLVPIPQKMNTWLYHHQAASLLFNAGTFAVAGGVIYVSAKQVVELGGLVKTHFEKKEREEKIVYPKKIKLD